MSGLREARQQALVLDFGGVVTRTLFETHAITEAALGLAPGTLKWRGPFDAGSDPLWRDMEAGRLSERDYWLARTREVGALLGEDWDRMETFVVRARGADPDAVIRPRRSPPSRRPRPPAAASPSCPTNWICSTAANCAAAWPCCARPTAS